MTQPPLNGHRQPSPNWFSALKISLTTFWCGIRLFFESLWNVNAQSTYNLPAKLASFDLWQLASTQLPHTQFLLLRPMSLLYSVCVSSLTQGYQIPDLSQPLILQICLAPLLYSSRTPRIPAWVQQASITLNLNNVRSSDNWLLLVFLWPLVL